MKKRVVGLVYLFPFLTGGIYFIYWILSLAYEINQYFKEEKIKFRSLIIKLSITFIVYMILFFIIIKSSNEDNNLSILVFFTCFAIGIYGLFLLISTLLKIVKNIEIIQEMENIEPKINKEFCLVMFLIYFIGIIILKKNINKIAEKSIE